MKKISAYAKLLRIPGIGALGIVPVIGALTVGVYDLYSLTLVFLIGAFSCIFGFILNDYIDIELDKLVDDLKKKPLVSGVVSKKSTLTITIFLIMFTFLIIAILWYGQIIDKYKITAISCIVIAGFLGSIYDIYGKKIVGSDFLVAISVSLIFLFGALSFGKPNIITWIIFVLTFNNILYMNAIQNGVKDADHDYKMEVKNIALSLGVKIKGNALSIPNPFKIFGLSIRFLSAFLLFTPFVFFKFTYNLFQIIVLILLTALFLILSIKFLTMGKFDRSKIRKIIGIQSFLRYSLVPIMLISIIGVYYSILLIIIPIIWYIIFTPLIGEKIFKPRM